jgi:hypothetical protein
MNKDELLEAANEWYEQDKSNRAVFHITAEADSNGNVCIHSSINGDGLFLCAIIYQTIIDNPNLYTILDTTLKAYKKEQLKAEQ